MFNRILSVTRKEFSSYFASPLAFIFLGTFLAVTLFVFFWVETFFARNIVDVRPLFEWMPILLIFLVAALTMRMWSEERRMGTLEILLTLPVSTPQLVIGKFLACLALVSVAMLLTVPLPITISFMGNLDWGPVIGAYIASILLAGAYLSIGLFMSSRTDNQIVSLILTSLVCFLFFILGSDNITAFFGRNIGEFLQALGTGSRFESITRGVLDFRDLYYYLSIMGVFLCLNVYILEKYSWSLPTADNRSNHSFWKLSTALLALNFIIGNFWLKEVHVVRADLTKGNLYSISDATKRFIGQLQEPLLIRGYFSSRTHPLLSPLVPQIKNLIREYEVAGDGRVRAEFIDPRENPDLEEEANQKYSIKPVPFQMADKYQASIVNSYFNVVVQYGDKFEVLDFEDLIEVKARSAADIDVQLRNPEYDITRSIKKVLYGFQDVDSLFASLKSPVVFKAYVSSKDKLPDQLQKFNTELESLLESLKKQSKGSFDYSFVEPEAKGGAVAKDIAKKYGFQPMLASFLDPQPFYFYLTLESGEKVVQLGLPENLDKDSAKKNIEAGLKRFSSGFLKAIGIHAKGEAAQSPFPGMRPGGGKQFRLVREKLQQSYDVNEVNLESGSVSSDVDLLAIVAPKDLKEKELFAIDQFLMKGGTLVLATSPVSVARSEMLSVAKHSSGIGDWLKHNGFSMEESLVMDEQNENYPVPVMRNIGGLSVQEISMVPYPPFVDIRSEGMNTENSITSGIPQITLNWPSPITVDTDKNSNRVVSTLLSSSSRSWVTSELEIQPNFDMYPNLGFAKTDKKGPFTLALVAEGEFTSYFKGKESPLLKKEEESGEETPADGEKKKEEEKLVVTSVLEKSPQSGRIILISSNEFLSDDTLNISAAIGSSRYLNSLQLIENAIDWSLEDRGLLAIRGRAHFGQTLESMTEGKILFWEYFNYALAFAGLLIVYALHRFLLRKRTVYYTSVLSPQGA
ncbi:MAG: Gldg family protein [Deltaproteobacteria bacterium]|nr:Gldg family protein [Deltaproteobacteria bacterium]